MTYARDIAFALVGSFLVAGFILGTGWLWIAILGAFFGIGR